MTNPTSTALTLMVERGIQTCQCCGLLPGEEAHHCLYGRKKGVYQLNEPENLQLVCRRCHYTTGKADSWENRVAFWEWACDFYGRDHMINYHKSLPLKVKERYEEL